MLLKTRTPGPRRVPRARAVGARAAVALSLLLCLSQACGARGAAAREPRARMAAAVAELERETSASKQGDEEKRRRSAALAAVRSELEAGRIYLSLLRLQAPYVETAARRYLDAYAGAGRGVEDFEREWERLGGELTEKGKRLSSLSSAGAPAAVRALAEAAQARSRPYYLSGRLYGLNTTPGDGLYYLAQASALLDFALFCRGLEFGQAPPPVALRPLGEELSALESSALAAYRRAEAASREANERQGLFNHANSTLKLAGELDREGLSAGALYAYLDATLLVGLTEAEPPYGAEVARLRQESEAFEKRLRAEGEDHSVGLLFWESARAALAGGGAEETRRASVILRRVLPAYFGGARPGDAPPVAARRAGAGGAGADPARKVKVTLVRWPYT